MENNTEITKEMFNEIYKHDYETDSHLINPYLIDNEKVISAVCEHADKEHTLEIVNKVYSKLIAADIESARYEDIASDIADVLSKCLKKKVIVDGNGLDGKDINVKID